MQRNSRLLMQRNCRLLRKDRILAAAAERAPARNKLRGHLCLGGWNCFRVQTGCRPLPLTYLPPPLWITPNLCAMRAISLIFACPEVVLVNLRPRRLSLLLRLLLCQTKCHGEINRKLTQDLQDLQVNTDVATQILPLSNSRMP